MKKQNISSSYPEHITVGSYPSGCMDLPYFPLDKKEGFQRYIGRCGLTVAPPLDFWRERRNDERKMSGSAAGDFACRMFF